MVKYKYDNNIMIKKIREKWTPEDFIQTTKGLMQVGGLYKDIDNNG